VEPNENTMVWRLLLIDLGTECALERQDFDDHKNAYEAYIRLRNQYNLVDKGSIVGGYQAYSKGIYLHVWADPKQDTKLN
jgi:hypothetical protein